ncbi:Alpha-1,6-mannosyl-glycoprotein 2-beta-N-acetylglucosaminyltransferase [Hypsibius exemplaris]|uniref:Alpha-1,6-mannosyl-glycoprotein 2-beta-N-acetylglucosaminyltransferase n=1 Tax=Hypsibius exemplaris TaxID=2072580 RepID=A0A1W0WZF9_HYPEX|nr:Alpha-1,6-mannosyl-glycoprotein 2-beta-N-acetylglucosaminyltransferase [Hypsibius exemplaris]
MARWPSPKRLLVAVGIIWLCGMAFIFKHVVDLITRTAVLEAEEEARWRNSTDAPVDLAGLKSLRTGVQARNAAASLKIANLISTSNFSHIIVAQIHSRIPYINALLDSMSTVRGIETALIVFSHDLVDLEIESAVATRNATLNIVQIYFPFSIQLHGNEFPAPGHRDCPERLEKRKAAKWGCRGSNSSDLYGNYRNAKLSQVKLHWWWKFHYTFTNISLARTGIPVLFVEEDHYLLPDALFLLDYFWKLRLTACDPPCPTVAIAHHRVKLADYDDAYRHYHIGPWSGSTNIGLIFSYDNYLTVANCSQVFCDVDDYNWDWSVYFIMNRCVETEFEMLMVKAPRILHIGNCAGLHHGKTDEECDMARNIAEAKKKVKKLTKNGDLFPVDMEQRRATWMQQQKEQVENGGWGDWRDRQLCRSITKSFIGRV